MSRFFTRAIILACLAGTTSVFADDEAPMRPVQSDDETSGDADATGEDSGEVAEPARLAPSAGYYDGAAGGVPQEYNTLFYNFYATPGNPAAMYPAPHPTPANIGHVYYTYQPFLPHEFLYPHFRQYYTFKGYRHGYEHLHGGRSYNVTTVRWTRGHAPTSWRPPRFHNPPRIPAIPTQRYPNH